MLPIPRDIIETTNRLFNNAEDAYEAHTLLATLWTRGLNVGPAQLARSILYLSGGDITKLRQIFELHFYGDPRDVIMDAESKAGNPGHYFIPPFDEMGKP